MAPECPAAQGPALEHRTGAVVFDQAPGKPRLNVEIADQAALRARGLMYRTLMPEDAGMLFVWAAEAPRSFWMRNTCIPLDMLFIAADGTIVGILEQVPTLNDAPRTVRCPAKYVLEVNAGWTREHGVRPGQIMAIEE